VLQIYGEVVVVMCNEVDAAEVMYSGVEAMKETSLDALTKDADAVGAVLSLSLSQEST
jgi:hypothetical protein